MSATVTSSSHPKICTKCGADVTHAKRFKDSAGRYYCAPCSGNAEIPVSNSATQAIENPDRATARSYGLVATVTCPHCWNVFPPEQVLWVSQHSDLMGDPILGPEKPRCFLPSRFTPDGQAIDARGTECQMLACPRCHLVIPRSVFEIEPMFISIIGGPKSGKSYFLAAMTWELRKHLPTEYALVFNDADTVSNQVLNDYEATLFLPDDPDKLVAIRKTDLEGELYDQVNLGGRVVLLPRPFLFNLRPASHHPNAAERGRASRVLCMYDNAGEHFQPGMDVNGSPVTQHLAKSKALIFLFDPTQDPRFRDQCRAISADPQLTGARGVQRQETLLIEAAQRVRRYGNLPPHAKHDRPLLVVVPKSDVWGPLLGMDVQSEPMLPQAVNGQISAFDVGRVEQVSAAVRGLLQKWTPELVAAAEDFCSHVAYFPVSALGRSPEEMTLADGKAGLFVKPRDIAPHWASVPVLYMFAKWATGIVASNGRTAVPHQAKLH